MRRLRSYSGLSQRDVARAAGVSQMTVLRWEKGDYLPDLRQAAAYGAAVGAPASAQARLADLARTALDFQTFGERAAETGLARIQDDVASVEAAYRALRHFQPAVIPGLLQAPAYARHVLRLTGRQKDDADLESAVAARTARQAILGDTSRTFEFLLAEAALRWVPAGAEPGMLAAQLRHVAAMSELPHISAGVILTGTPLRVIPLCGFVLHDDPAGGSEPMVQYDIPHTGGYATAPGDVRVYRDQLAALRDAAVTGLAAAAAIRVIAGEAV
jgi:DNA-binding XRE family transcriptional regulator